MASHTVGTLLLVVLVIALSYQVEGLGTVPHFRQKLVPFSNGANIYLSGQSVAITSSGTRAIVSGTGNGVPNFNGAATVYDRTGNTWINTTHLISTDGATVQQGGLVAISSDGNTVAVSDSRRGPMTEQGGVILFTYNGSVWTEDTVLQESSPASFTYISENGLAISSDGKTVACSREAIAGIQGGVVVFYKSGSTWAQQGSTIFPPNLEMGFGVGYGASLSGDGNILAFGAPLNNSQMGAAFVYQRTTGTWGPYGAGVLTPPSDFYLFGYATALSQDGSVLAVTQPYYPGAPAEPVVIYVVSGGQYTILQTLLQSGASGCFGSSIAMTTSASRLVIGDACLNKISYPGSRGIYQGGAFIFDRLTPSSNYTYTGVINGLSTTPYTLNDAYVDFGAEEQTIGVSDDNRIIIGAQGDNFGVGAAFVFDSATSAPTTSAPTGSPTTKSLGTIVSTGFKGILSMLIVCVIMAL